jgi:WD40 repeat protein
LQLGVLVKRALNADSGWVNAVAWSHCGKWLASGGDDKMVYIYDAQTIEVKCPVTGHSGAVSSVAFSADGRWVMSGSKDKTIRLWDIHGVAQ